MSDNVLTQRQELLLECIVRQYLQTTEPVGSLELKKTAKLDISPATVRNDLQELTRMGFIEQPHTSAGRVPTKKGYQHIAKLVQDERQRQFDKFIEQQIRFAHQEMAREMQMMQEMMQVMDKGDMFEILTILEKWNKI